MSNKGYMSVKSKYSKISYEPMMSPVVLPPSPSLSSLACPIMAISSRGTFGSTANLGIGSPDVGVNSSGSLAG